jgi:hypothetical protein
MAAMLARPGEVPVADPGQCPVGDLRNHLPGAGALALVWVIGAYSVVFGILLVGLSLRLRRHRRA